MSKEYFSHETAVVDEGCKIGKGTKIWHFSHIMTGSEIGENCNIGQNVVVSPDVKLGNNVKVQNNVSIYTGVICDDDVFLGPSMVFTNVINPRSEIVRKDQYVETIVERGATIGANATIVCGNIIGRYAFVGAGAVVTKDVKPYALVFGNPARQTGWMSEFGHKLKFDDMGYAYCPESNDRYKLEKGHGFENNIVILLAINDQRMNGNPKNFGIIGVAGYIAVRHLHAIKETGNNLLASLDKFDSVGRIDSYFPESDFFVEFERFDRHFDKLKRTGTKIDYVSICSPNYLHDSHIRFALRHQAEAICEKPIVLNPWNIDALQEIENETGRNIYTVLQLRLHPRLQELRERVRNGPKGKVYDVDLSYITSRGNWYSISWKGDIQKSGGIATNIGIHFFDMLNWIFGSVKNNVVHLSEPHKSAGFLELENARVRWFLSIDYNDIPARIKTAGLRTFRSITVDGEEIEFSEGFTDLHTLTYKEILAGRGFGLKDARPSVEIAYTIRNSKAVGLQGDYHPMLNTIK